MPDGMRGRNLLRHRSLDGSRRYLDACTLFRCDELRKLFTTSFAEQVSAHDPSASKLAQLDAPAPDWLASIQRLDIENYLPLDILTKVDRMSMAHSIESRVPLLDHKLVEFAATLPLHLRLQSGVTKYIFKRAMDGILPAAILHRAKKGFAVPLGYWFRGHLREYAHDILLGQKTKSQGMLNTAYLERLLSQNANGREVDLHLWTAMSFQLWINRFLVRQSPGIGIEAA
jgi:asparagine synthase (glutamine-hydrolysing)